MIIRIGFIAMLMWSTHLLAQNDVSVQGGTNETKSKFVLHSKPEAVFRSLVVPGWGQFYNEQPMKGKFILASEVVLVSGMLFFNSQYSKAHNDYTMATDPNATEDLFDKAEGKRKTRDALGYLAAGIWVYNLVDAYLCGWDGENKAAAQLQISPTKASLRMKAELVYKM